MPELVYRKQFEDILKSYSPAKEVVVTAKDTNLILFAGVTSSGRNTIMNQLVKRFGYYHVVSDTTRPKRSNNGVMEVDGVQYNFKPEQEFLAGLENGRYLEAEIIHNQQVSGISFEELGKARSKSNVCMTDIENRGAINIPSYLPKAKVIFLIPPAFDIWMKRLTDRGELDQEEIMRRLASAEKELEQALEREDFQILVNDELEEAVSEANEIIEGKRDSKFESEGAVQEVAWRLLNEIKQAVHS